MGDGAADGASESKAGVEVDAAQLLRSRSLDLRLHLVQLRAGLLYCGAHLAGICNFLPKQLE